MIRNEAEYQEASKRLGDELKRLGEHRARLKEAGLGDVEIKRVIRSTRILSPAVNGRS
jgi:hypothetical protein